MHHVGYLFQQFWNDDEAYREQVKRRSRRRPRPPRSGRPKRPDSF
jgi:hypothetical protein